MQVQLTLATTPSAAQSGQSHSVPKPLKCEVRILAATHTFALHGQVWGTSSRQLAGHPLLRCHPCASPAFAARPPRQSTDASATLLTYGVHSAVAQHLDDPFILLVSFLPSFFFLFVFEMHDSGFTSRFLAPINITLPATGSKLNVNHHTRKARA